MENDMGYIYNSTYTGRIKDLNSKYKYSIKPSTLSKDCNNLQKIIENNIISTSGEQPLLLYKKKDNKASHSFDYKMTKKNSDKNMYISDGGLKLKNEKYNAGYSNTNANQNQNRKQIKSLRTYLESINVNKLLKTPGIQNKKQVKPNNKNSNKNMKVEENIFYETVRGRSNRPIFQKKFYKNDKNHFHTEESFGLKSKMDLQNHKQKKIPKKKNKLEESKKYDENKNELIDSLINGAIKNNFFSIQNTETKITPKKILAEKKKEYLQRNGIGISDVNLDENDYENNKDDEKDEIKKLSKTTNNFNQVKLNNYVKISTNFSPKQKNYYMTLNNETHFLNSHPKNKKQIKPIVDQFEYIKKINKLHRRLCTNENLLKKSKNKISEEEKEENEKKNNQLNDSFRHKNKIDPQNVNKINNFEKVYLHQKKGDNPSSLVDVNDEWPYSHKRSYRSPKEINKFVKEKKLKYKKKANNDELQKNTKLFIKFKNLYNLNYKGVNNNLPINQDKDKIKEKENNKDKDKDKDIKEKIISTKINNINKPNKERHNNSGLKRKKEANEYYVGNDSLINNNSTLIDPNEYYLNVLESQQLLVNSGLNKIENESDEETEELTDNIEDNNNLIGPNEGNTSKEQIQNIIKKQSKGMKQNNINNNLNINNIKTNLNNKNILKNEIKINNNDNNNNNKIIKKLNNNTIAKSSINPNDVIKFVEVLKFIIQRKIYIILYRLYINEAIFQHYKIAFTYFIAVCKHKPFRKIEEYCNYKEYNKNFRKLIIPFVKRNFRQFVHNIYLRRHLEFLIILLTKFFKFKILERIFIYAQIMANDEEERQFELVILKIMRTLFSPHLRVVFDKLKNYNKNKNDKNELENKDKDDDIFKNKKEDKNTNEKIIPKSDIKEKINEDSKQEERNIKIHKKYLEYSPTHNNKANSFLYESFSEGSSIDLRHLNNSLDNDKYHQILIKIQNEKKKLFDYDFEEEEDENDDYVDINKYKKINYPQNNSFNSKKSEKSFNLSNEKSKDKKEPIVNNNINKEININSKDNIPNNINEEKNQITDIPSIKKEEDKKINDNNDKKNINININISNQKEDEDTNKDKNIKKNKDINIIVEDKKIDNKKNINDNSNINNINKEKNNLQNNINKDNKDIDKDKNDQKKDDIIKNDENINKEEDNHFINILKNEIKKEEDKKNLPNEKKDKLKPKNEEKPKSNEQNNNINNEKVINKKKEEEELFDSDEMQEKQDKNITASEIDISAEKDEPNSIDWEYNLSNSKNLQGSTNSENLNSKEPKEEKLNNDLNEKEKKSPSKNMEIEDIIIHKEEPKIIKSEISKEEEKKAYLVDDDDEIEEDEKKIIPDKKKSKTLIKDKNTLNESEDEYLDEFKDIDINSDIESDSDLKSSRKEKNEKDKDKDKKLDNNKEKNDKSRNINSESNIKDIKIDENIQENEIISKPSSSPVSLEALKNIKDKSKFSNDLTDEILKKLLSSEITSNKVKLIPHKSFKYELFTNLTGSQSNLSASYGSSGNNFKNDLGLLSLGQLSLSDDFSSLNDSIMSSYTAFSVFNRTIKDKKKEHSLNLYYRKIAPKLIKLIKEEIYLKYPRIYKNISTPLKNQSVGLMMSLSLQDADMLRDNYKCILMKESIKNIIDKEKILKKFEPINIKIRSKDNLTSDNFYDSMLNECLVDTAIELINKERLYGENGDPLAWSSRTHELAFKYPKDDPKKLAKFVCSNLLKTLHFRVGLITENYDYMNAEQINNERDKRLIDNIKNELDEDEYQWRNLEMEETQLKVEIAELIMDQLYNENIEILEHIQYSRNRPDLYQNKSIYACEEIPKLSFQQTTTENAAKDKDDEDEVINV